jgi:magnesium-transporting ATPase (P-type)
MAKKTGGPSEEGVANHVSGQSNKPMSKPAHALTYEEVARELGADLQNGLSNEEHKKRLEENGRNEFGETEGVQPIRIFIGQIANSLTMVSAVFSIFVFFLHLHPGFCDHPPDSSAPTCDSVTRSQWVVCFALWIRVS